MYCSASIQTRWQPCGCLANKGNGQARQYVDYAASKGAVDVMTLGLAQEVAVEGIRVNAVCPVSLKRIFMPAGGIRAATSDRAAAQPRPARWCGLSSVLALEACAAAAALAGTSVREWSWAGSSERLDVEFVSLAHAVTPGDAAFCVSPDVLARGPPFFWQTATLSGSQPSLERARRGLSFSDGRAHDRHPDDGLHAVDVDFHALRGLDAACGAVAGARDDGGSTQAYMQDARSSRSRHKADRCRYRYTRSCIQGLPRSSPTKARRAQRLQTVSSCAKSRRTNIARVFNV